LSGLARLWSLCLIHDPLDPQRLERFFDDPACYEPDAALVAEADGAIAGFIMGIANQGDTGWVPVFLVHPEHYAGDVGDSLLRQLEGLFSSRGVKRIRVEPLGGELRFFTGIDRRYQELLAILSRDGFAVADDSQVDIVKDLTSFEMPAWAAGAKKSLEKQGFTFGFCEPHLRQAYLEFMSTHFGGYGGWMIETRKYVEEGGDPRLRMLAFLSGEIVGFTAYAKEDDWYIWSTGVRQDLRGKKVGSVLVFLALEEMKRRSAARMCVYDCPIEFYKIPEGEVVRRYVMMAKDLNPSPDPGGRPAAG
jgi:GNAT superfamily N-acetyltransferase